MCVQRKFVPTAPKHSSKVAVRTCAKLLELKADPRHRTEEDGWTALYAASYRFDAGPLRFLLEHGAEADLGNI